MNIRVTIGAVIAALIALVAVISVFGSFTTIDQGERGIKLRNGKVIQVIEPGPAWKIPVFESIERVSVRTNVYSLLDYKTYSGDQQPATLKVSVTFKADESRVSDVYSEYGTLGVLAGRVIAPRLPTAIKNEFGKYTAEQAIKNNDKLVIGITESLTNLTLDDPVEIVAVQVEKVEFSDSYEKTIEDKQRADVMIATVTSNANARTAEAQGIKQAAILEAEGKAKAVILAGDAEAQAIRVKSKALLENPTLVELIYAERWNGVLPVTMNPNSAVPFFNLK